MPMSPFFQRCLETAMAETRTVTFLDDRYGIPPGEMVFDEFYCDEFGCDCRRVLLRARVSHDFDHSLASVSYGWERPEFYQAWSKALEPAEASGMAGASLELLAPQSRYAESILDYAEEHLFGDPLYVARLQRHYAQFKATLRRSPKGGTGFDWRRRARPGGGRKRR